MKVFFTASQKGKEQFDEYYHLIFNQINSMGHKNIDDRVINSTAEEFYDRLKKEGVKAYNALFKENIRLLQEADINIFECSFQSFSIGYMVQKSIELNKPTVALYLPNNTLYFLAGSDDDLLIIKSYTKDTLKKVLQEIFDEARNITDKRFNFFISPSLLTYLNDVSKNQGITKSTFIRNLLLENKRKSIE